jgi:hypothetical protein
VACTGNGTKLMEQVDIAFTHDSYEGNMSMTFGGETNKFHVVGKRIGACDASGGGKRSRK